VGRRLIWDKIKTMNLKAELERRVHAALTAAGAPADTPALIATAARPEFGDYQANGVMAAAKKLKTNPRQLAEKVVEALDLSDLAEKVEIAGAGFINITLSRDWLARELATRPNHDKLGVEPPANPQTVVVDYSGPNLAKEMHVGHLRSTIIGDALARVLDFQGHEPVRQNHVGDWGTQFGMLTAYLTAAGALADAGGAEILRLNDLEEIYRQAKQKFDADGEFADLSRQCVVGLHSGDPDILEHWRRCRELSLDHCFEIYDKLGISLERADVRGESFYNDDLPNVIRDLEAKGLLSESQGAQCVFLDQFKDRDGEPLPLIVQKTDGGYLYATTDLAAIRFRCGKGKADGVIDWVADRALYVTDSRQALHFAQVFAAARAAGFAGERVSLEHVPFGTMMGADRKPFKTREGGTVKLMDLLDEAEQRALAMVRDKSAERGQDLSAESLQNIARAVGIGAVKYADLSQNRTSDYVFSWDKMLSLEGNTAPYMQYAYARIRSIFRKGSADVASEAGPLVLDHAAERALALKLVQFPEVVNAVAAECLPNLLCAYLYELAGAFMGFYENCPVLQSDEPLRASRLRLCDMTARTIQTGLGLLGIETIEQM